MRTLGLLLTGQFAVMLAGALMFVGRGGLQDPRPGPPNTAYLVLERGLIMTAVILVALGLVMLAATGHTGQPPLAWLGATGYAAAAVVLVAAETNGLLTGDAPYTAIVVYVVAAFASQAIFGAALIRSELLAAWIGWTMIAWNLAWAAYLPITSPDDIYFPVLHHVMPLIIGGKLLLQRVDPAVPR